VHFYSHNSNSWKKIKKIVQYSSNTKKNSGNIFANKSSNVQYADIDHKNPKIYE